MDKLKKFIKEKFYNGELFFFGSSRPDSVFLPCFASVAEMETFFNLNSDARATLTKYLNNKRVRVYENVKSLIDLVEGETDEEKFEELKKELKKKDDKLTCLKLAYVRCFFLK